MQRSLRFLVLVKILWAHLLRYIIPTHFHSEGYLIKSAPIKPWNYLMAFQQFHISFLALYEHASVWMLWVFCGFWDSLKRTHLLPVLLVYPFFGGGRESHFFVFVFFVPVSTSFFLGFALFYQWPSLQFCLLVLPSDPYFCKSCRVLTLKQWGRLCE